MTADQVVWRESLPQSFGRQWWAKVPNGVGEFVGDVCEVGTSLNGGRPGARIWVGYLSVVALLWHRNFDTAEEAKAECARVMVATAALVATKKEV